MNDAADESIILQKLAGLPTSREGYTNQERYHDFRRLFLGSDEGKRVLREIVSWAGLLRIHVHRNPIDPYRLAQINGEQNVVRRLIATVYEEPRDPPQKATTKKE